MKFIPSERSIQTACIQLLRLHGYYVQRLNSGAIRTGERNRLIRLAVAGTPDIMAFRLKPWTIRLDLIGSSEPTVAGVDAISLIFIEVKRPGKEPTLLQTLKMQELMKYGAACYVVHSSEELEKLL